MISGISASKAAARPRPRDGVMEAGQGDPRPLRQSHLSYLWRNLPYLSHWPLHRSPT
jgi:hypothetical protein